MKLTAFCLAACLSAPEVWASSPATRSPGWPQALRLADFILGLQNADGAVEDARGSNTVNSDSNMQYALIALAAAYEHTGQKKYLRGLEKGIAWLADREDLSDPTFKGSWWYGYDLEGRHVPTPPGPGFVDARGVDTTSALFVYLLYLDQRVNPATRLPGIYREHAMAALRFIEQVSTDTDGLTWSSWIVDAEGHWRLWNYKYSADQGDVYLGFKAAAAIYDPAKYGPLAEALKLKVQQRFYSPAQGRYPLGMDGQGLLDWTVKSFDPIQCQGFLPWMWGDSEANRAALTWLASKVQPDGGLHVCEGDPGYSLSAAMLGLGAAGLGQPRPAKTLDWLTSPRIWNATTGGVYDTKAAHDEFCNNAGLCAIALVGWPAFAEAKHPVAPVRKGRVTASGAPGQGK